jgi:hypothetical protein
LGLTWLGKPRKMTTQKRGTGKIGSAGFLRFLNRTPKIVSLNFKPIKNGHSFSPWVKELRGKSGAYIIRSPGILGEILYIGESHTNRLYSTLIRHFQHWTGPTAGPTFAPSKIEVAIVRTPANRALEIQIALIEEHRPKLNVTDKPPGFWEKLTGLKQ